MSRQIIALAGLLVLAVGCSSQPVEPQLGPSTSVVLYEGARLISGDDRPPIEDSALLVDGDTITGVGRRGEITAPEDATRVDLTGKTVMPALIGTHGHPGFQKGLTYSAENYTRETLIDDLNRAAYYGVGVVQSQGIEPGDLSYQIRAAQAAGELGGARLRIGGRGIGAPNAGPGAAAFQGIAYEVTSEDEARRSVQELAAAEVDLIKIWVDDRGGRAPRLTPALFRAVIDESHGRGLPVTAHVFYHTDAVELVDAGVDGFAHLVRDMEMDDALVAAIVERGVFVQGNLSSPNRGTYGELPPWLQEGDPLMQLLQDTVPPDVIQRMQESFANRDPAAVEGARQRYGILERSMAKLSAAGAPIVLGADTGLQDHVFGFAEQRELELMVAAGMTPAQAIVAATSRGAEYLRLEDTGSLAPGKRADFLVLDEDPLDDITNTRRIAAVYLGGTEVDRARLRAAWTSGATN